MIKPLKQNIKHVLGNVLALNPHKINMDASSARNVLDEYSRCPDGTCVADNKLDLKYDLQIVVPAYNAEKYIEACLDSVLTQETSYRYFVTVINDGSTDATHDILQKASRGGRNSCCTLRIIEQDNRGFSGARNAGLAIIEGKYVMFVDSDDVLPPGTIQTMLDAAFAADADILQGSWYTFTGERKESHIVEKEGTFTDSSGVISGFPWGKVYRYNVLLGYQFPEGYWFEDTPISCILAGKRYTYAAIKDVCYGYRINPEGITSSAARSAKAVDTYWITELCYKEYGAFDVHYDQRAYEYLLRQIITNWHRTKNKPLIIRKAIFTLEAGLLEEYFKNHTTADKRLKAIDRAVRNRQFTRYEGLMLRG